MAIPRKGSRRIHVAGHDYRWTVAPDNEPGVGIVVERWDTPRQRLLVWVKHGVRITPAVVRQVIEMGLAAGWRGDKSGPDYVKSLRGRRWPATNTLKQCPCCDYFSLPARGHYDICPLCFWEDSGQDVEQLDRISGPNHITLREARWNFRTLGACDARAVPHVASETARQYYVRQPRNLDEELERKT